MPVIPVLEVAIALALLYLFFSQIVTSVFEGWATLWNKRGRYLRYYLNRALNSGNDKNWAELVYRHPSVDMLAQKNTRSPEYIPSSVFVKAIVDLVIDEVRVHQFVDSSLAATPAATPQRELLTGEYVYRSEDPPGTSLAKFEAGLAKVQEGDFKALMRSLLLNARGCTTCQGTSEEDEKIFAEFIHGLAVWYDGYMERVSGWYKRSIRSSLFVVGLLVAVGCNLDSLRVASYLWTHSADRQRIVAYAARQAADSSSARRLLMTPSPDSPGLLKAQRQYARRVDSLSRALQTLGFPIGWSFDTTAQTLDTVYRQVAASPPDADGWQKPAHWVRYSRTRELYPARRRTAIDSGAPIGLPLQLLNGESGGAQDRSAAPHTAVSIEQQVVTQFDNPNRVVQTPSRPAPTASPPNTMLDVRLSPPTSAPMVVRSRLVWKPDTLLALPAALQLVDLPAKQKTAITAQKLPGLPAKAALLQADASHTANLPSGIWWAALGWLITAAALSIGAPFWFEILNRFINIRNLGVRPPSSLPTPSSESR